MMTRTTLIFASLGASSLAASPSGQASADWLSPSATYQPGQPLQTAVRMVVNPDWHTYWENPGEGGMKISVNWELPAGWEAGPLLHPVPIRFMTGDLPGFGYEGTVVFPVTLTPPADFSGEAHLKGKLSWLTCNDEKCLPGDAALELKLTSGAPKATEQAELVEKALTKVPTSADKDTQLTVVEKPQSLILTLTSKPGVDLKWSDFEVFPATPQTIAAAAKIEFKQVGAHWSAEVPKSEYAPQAVPQLTLVFAGKPPQLPLSLSWKAP
jgi:DsbC/DsbD-like thiol-disulfide interchange protein